MDIRSGEQKQKNIRSEKKHSPVFEHFTVEGFFNTTAVVRLRDFQYKTSCDGLRGQLPGHLALRGTAVTLVISLTIDLQFKVGVYLAYFNQQRM